jgi:hypothetical protein
MSFSLDRSISVKRTVAWLCTWETGGTRVASRIGSRPYCSEVYFPAIRPGGALRRKRGSTNVLLRLRFCRHDCSPTVKELRGTLAVPDRRGPTELKRRRERRLKPRFSTSGIARTLPPSGVVTACLWSTILRPRRVTGPGADNHSTHSTAAINPPTDILAARMRFGGSPGALSFFARQVR